MKKTLLSLILASLLLVSLLSLGSCGEQSASGKAVTLYVYNWGEYISDGSEGSLNVNQAFEDYCREELGLDVTVNYST